MMFLLFSLRAFSERGFDLLLWRLAFLSWRYFLNNFCKRKAVLLRFDKIVCWWGELFGLIWNDWPCFGSWLLSLRGWRLFKLLSLLPKSSNFLWNESFKSFLDSFGMIFETSFHFLKKDFTKLVEPIQYFFLNKLLWLLAWVIGKSFYRLCKLGKYVLLNLINFIPVLRTHKLKINIFTFCIGLRKILVFERRFKSSWFEWNLASFIKKIHLLEFFSQLLYIRFRHKRFFIWYQNFFFCKLDLDF